MAVVTARRRRAMGRTRCFEGVHGPRENHAAEPLDAVPVCGSGSAAALVAFLTTPPARPSAEPVVGVAIESRRRCRSCAFAMSLVRVGPGLVGLATGCLALLQVFIYPEAAAGRGSRREKLCLHTSLAAILCLSVVGSICDSPNRQCKGNLYVHSFFAITWFVLYDLSCSLRTSGTWCWLCWRPVVQLYGRRTTRGSGGSRAWSGRISSWC